MPDCANTTRSDRPVGTGSRRGTLVPSFVHKISGLFLVYAVSTSGRWLVGSVLIAAIVVLIAGRWVLSDEARTEHLAALIDAVRRHDRRVRHGASKRRNKRR